MDGLLIQEARAEGIESLEIIKLLVEQAGWRFEVQNNLVDPTFLDSNQSSGPSLIGPNQTFKDAYKYLVVCSILVACVLVIVAGISIECSFYY